MKTDFLDDFESWCHVMNRITEIEKELLAMKDSQRRRELDEKYPVTYHDPRDAP